VAVDNVLWVCESSKDVWNDVHPSSQAFIKNYLKKYPERPMVRLSKGTIVSTEWNGLKLTRAEEE
jgi:histone-lysine N-methyltransferase SETDB1